jgi:hypothetical protein
LFFVSTCVLVCERHACVSYETIRKISRLAKHIKMVTICVNNITSPAPNHDEQH